LERRKEKENNVQRILREKYEANENAKLVLGSIRKNYNNSKCDIDGWRKAEDIDLKIKQCRERADWYRTTYQRKLHEETVNKEKTAWERRMEKLKEDNQKSMNFHLAEWKEFERKKAEKHKAEPQPNNLTKVEKKITKEPIQLKTIT
jgi:hypothetical protein